MGYCNSPFNPFLYFSNTRWSEPSNPSPVLLILTIFLWFLVIWYDLCSLQERHCWKWKRLSTTPEMSSETGMVQMPLHVTGLASVATFMTIGSGLCMWLTPFCLTFFWSRRKVGFKGEWFFYVDWCLYFLKLWFLCGESTFPRFQRNHFRPKR